MKQKLVKINYSGLDCSGLYLVLDESYGGNEITNNEIKKIKPPFKVVLRQSVVVDGKKITSKKTFTFKGISLYIAIKERFGAKREALKQEIITKATRTEDMRDPDTITVNQLWDDYYKFRTTSAIQGKRQKKWETKYSVNGKRIGGTAYIMECVYNGLIKSYLGSKPVMQIKKRDIEDLINMLISEKGYSERYVKGVLDILKPMIEWFFDREEIDKRNPAGNVSIQFNNKRDVEVAFQDMQKLYQTMFTYKNEKYRNVFIWLASGRRIGEVLSLHTDNIKGDYYTIIAENNKAKVDMIYKMSNAMKRTIPDNGYVHTSVKNSSLPLSKASVDRHWVNIKKETGLNDLHIHDLRHLLATEMKNSGVPLEIRSWVLGHKVAGMTGRYERDTNEQADVKLKAVDLIILKLLGKVERNLKYNDYLRRISQ